MTISNETLQQLDSELLEARRHLLKLISNEKLDSRLLRYAEAYAYLTAPQQPHGNSAPITNN